MSRRIMRNCSRRPGSPEITPACTAPSISATTTSGACWSGRCRERLRNFMAGLVVPAIHALPPRSTKRRGCPGQARARRKPEPESQLMDSPEISTELATSASVMPSKRPPRIWKFWGTAAWGLFIFAAMFIGQIAVVAWFLVQQEGSLDRAALVRIASNGLVISLSVILELPAVLAALWVAIRLSRTPFADYLALRWTSWTNVLIGVVALLALVLAWEGLSELIGHESSPGFMVDLLKSARAGGGLWLLVIAFAIAAPVSEELVARGFLYR